MNPPKMMPGTVEMVNMTWLMKNADGSVDGFTDANGGVNYQRMVERKGTDYQMPAVINALYTKGFRVPIVMYRTASGELYHGNGHHRFVAALLLGLDEIPVFWPADNDYMSTEVSELDEDEFNVDDSGEFEGVYSLI